MTIKEEVEQAAVKAAHAYACEDSDEPCYNYDYYQGFIDGAEYLRERILQECFPMAVRNTKNAERKQEPPNT